MLTITKSSLHWHQHEVKSGLQDPIAWFPQPIVRYLSLPLLVRHRHRLRLVAVYWSQKERSSLFLSASDTPHIQVSHPT